VTRWTAVLLVTLALGLSACSAITGRPFVEWSDDKALTARTAHYLLVLWHVPELTRAR
jgi:hypothetical protein